MRIVLMSVLITVGSIVAGLSFADIDPGDVVNGHVWLFDGVAGNTVEDSSPNNLSGNINGEPEVVKGLNGNALKFDGVDDHIKVPDSAKINITSGPWPNRTVKVIFNCADVSKQDKQTIWEEGGRTRGLVIYVFEGELYVGGWNRDTAQIDWRPGSWISTPIQSNRWYEVALILRDTVFSVDPDKFEMWLDGKLVGKEQAGPIYNHSDDIGIAATNQNTIFHDDDGSGDGWYFEGMIDEVWVLNQALTAADLKPAEISVEPAGKLAAIWGAIRAKNQ